MLPLTLTACVSPAVVPYLGAKGAYQTVSGTTNDGRRFTGAAWVTFGDPTGRFCARVSGKYSCTGTYDGTSQAPVIEGRFTCTDRVTGRSRTEQRLDPRLNSLVGVSGTARLTDGTRATYTLGPSTPWNGENLCT
jgi:hypothetical protein